MQNWRLRWEMTLWAIFCIFFNRFQWTHVKFCHWYYWCFSISGSASHQSWKLWRIPVFLRKVRFPVLISNIYVTSKRCISLSSKRLKSIILAAFLASVNSLLKNGFTPWTKDVCLTCELSELQKSLSLKAVRPSLKVLAPKINGAKKLCVEKYLCLERQVLFPQCVLTIICSEKGIISVFKEYESHWNMVDAESENVLRFWAARVARP